MAFNNVGALSTLAEGQSAFWWHTHGAGNHGTQIATADVKAPNSGAILIANDQGKSLDNNNNATYFVTIRNIGPGSVFYNLQGGGVV
jgi:hypothetical protein